tara:strand:+ start:322 stop:501 length:180 start_codon:yes stop_codon:yes gene_type:complete
MKIDLYTKGILTVIAFALVIIVAKDIVPIKEAYANNCATRTDLYNAVQDISVLIIAYSS